MANIETEPVPGKTVEGGKPLHDALADFEKIEDDPHFRLGKDETIQEYFINRAKESEIILVIPLPKEEDLTKTASELRSAIFGYLKEYVSIAFAHLDEKQKEMAEADIEIMLGEIIGNVRHSENTDKLHNLYIKVQKVGDIILSIKLINPTTENPENFATKHGDEYWHGSDIIPGMQSDSKSQVKIVSQRIPVLDEGENVGCESDVALGPKDKVGDGEIEKYI